MKRVSLGRDGTGSEPLTRDPTRSLSGCALNQEIILTTVCNALCQKSLVCSTHTDHDVKIQKTHPTDSKVAYCLPNSNNKARAKNYRNRIRQLVCHIYL